MTSFPTIASTLYDLDSPLRGWDADTNLQLMELFIARQANIYERALRQADLFTLDATTNPSPSINTTPVDPDAIDRFGSSSAGFLPNDGIRCSQLMRTSETSISSQLTLAGTGSGLDSSLVTLNTGTASTAVLPMWGLTPASQFGVFAPGTYIWVQEMLDGATGNFIIEIEAIGNALAPSGSAAIGVEMQHLNWKIAP